MKPSSDIERYLASCQSIFWQAVFRAEIDYLLQHVAAGEDILSVGCGPAIIESALSAHGCRITGLDVSAEALGRAPDYIRTVVARAEEMPFPPSAFDAVLYVASLQFIQNYRKALHKTARVLRPRGRLLVLLLNPASRFFKEKLQDPNSYVRHIKHTDLKAIEDAVREAFTVQTEYHLGVREDVIFPSRDPAEAVLYIIRGTKKARRSENSR